MKESKTLIEHLTGVLPRRKKVLLSMVESINDDYSKNNPVKYAKIVEIANDMLMKNIQFNSQDSREYNNKVIKRQLSGNIKIDLYKIDDEYIREDGKIKLYIVMKDDNSLTMRLGLNSSIEVGKGDIFPEQNAVNSEWSCLIKMNTIHEEYVSSTGTMTVYAGFRWYEGENEPNMTITQVVPRNVLDLLETTKIGYGSCRTHQAETFKNKIKQFKNGDTQ